MFKRGDIVKVYSLQSFFGGGFLNGKEGIVAQDQYGDSVLVLVERIIDGQPKIDPSYEVYGQQLELVKRPVTERVREFSDLIDKLKHK